MSLVNFVLSSVVVALAVWGPGETAVRAESSAETKGATDRLGAGTDEMLRETVNEGRSFIDDTMITAHVKASLMKDPKTSALAIGVETVNGTVQLSGFVDSAEEKQRAEQIAASVEGVIAVQNALSVK